MTSANAILSRVPILKTLAVCPDISKKHARIELFWAVGFALCAVPVVLVIVLFTRPIAELPRQVFEIVGRGELMVYAAAVCGTALYSLRHSIEGPIPEAIKAQVTPIGTLSVGTSLLLIIALLSYVVRRMGDINHIELNESLLNFMSFVVLLLSLMFAYVVLSLKFALASGAAPASHEQTVDFSKVWEAERDA